MSVNDIDFIKVTLRTGIGPKELYLKMKEKAEKVAGGKQIKCITYIGSTVYRNTQEIQFYIEYKEEECG